MNAPSSVRALFADLSTWWLRGEGFTPDLRQRVIVRDGRHCVCCGRQVNARQAKVCPRRRRPWWLRPDAHTWSPANWVTKCPTCVKEQRWSAEAKKQDGYGCLRWNVDPTTVPVRQARVLPDEAPYPDGTPHSEPFWMYLTGYGTVVDADETPLWGIEVRVQADKKHRPVFHCYRSHAEACSAAARRNLAHTTDTGRLEPIAWVTRSPYGPAEHLLRIAKREEMYARRAEEARAKAADEPVAVTR